MRIIGWPARLLFVIGTTAMSLSVISSSSGLLGAQDGNRVEIVIRNSSYELHGGTLKPHTPATILVRNTDPQRHGFTSPSFERLDIEVETRDGVTFGRGIKGVHINPKESMTLRFTPVQEGQFKFSCDLHPGMKGELLVLSIGEV